MRGGRWIAVMLAMLVPAGCAGVHNTCRYGLRNTGTGNTCNSRSKPSDTQVQQASSGTALANALAAWKQRPKSAVVNAVGINHWAETTFTVRTALNGPHEYTLTTYDAAGKPTSGNENYVSGPRDRFPVSAVHPDVLAKAIAAIRAKQPAVQMITASLAIAPFINELAWDIQMISGDASSSIIYQVRPNGAGLCHGKDSVPDDALSPAPGIPLCPNPVFANI
jgi:hypothetical protein